MPGLSLTAPRNGANGCKDYTDVCLASQARGIWFSDRPQWAARLF
ncbi:hypothetical protein EV13_1957 [Prochlorococcus sp. MIT 0702]|nr:hypothetical protein EV13_1957 [Prochlorococcus sp. MIT 0702]